MDNSTAARPSDNCLWRLTQDPLGLTVPVGHCCKLFPVYLSIYIYQSCNIPTFNAGHFDENPLTCQCEKENKKAFGFQMPLLH